MNNCLKFLLYVTVIAAFCSAKADPSSDFFRAVNVDNDLTVKAQLAIGFNPNTRNEQGQPALFVALRDESHKVVAALLAHPAIRVDTTTSADETPLMMAALRGNLSSTQRLVEAGAALNRPGWAPLHYAASGSGVAVVRWLLDQGAAIDALSPNRSTALMMAARYGALDSAALLLSRGANPRLRNERDLSAADFARAADREALATRLEQASR